MKRINRTDMGIKYRTDGDKMRSFNDAMSYIVLIIHNKSYIAIWMMGIIILNIKFSVSVAS